MNFNASLYADTKNNNSSWAGVLKRSIPTMSEQTLSTKDNGRKKLVGRRCAEIV